MRGLLLVILGLLLLAPTAQGETYSCRDSRGQLHFSDNLHELPEECLGKEKVVPSTSSDNLQFVPDTPVSREEERRFEKSVQEVERSLEQRKAELQQMRARAENLQQRYQQLMEQIRRARRINDIPARQQLKLLKPQRKELYAEKMKLQDELAGSRLGREDVAAVEALLEEISAE